MTVEADKRGRANRIAAANSVRMFSSRQQVVLRSLVVMRYQVDTESRLFHSEAMRSDSDQVADADALTPWK